MNWEAPWIQSDGDDTGDDHDGRDVRDVTIFLVVFVSSSRIKVSEAGQPSVVVHAEQATDFPNAAWADAPDHERPAARELPGLPLDSGSRSTQMRYELIWSSGNTLLILAGTHRTPGSHGRFGQGVSREVSECSTSHVARRTSILYLPTRIPVSSFASAPPCDVVTSIA